MVTLPLLIWEILVLPPGFMRGLHQPPITIVLMDIQLTNIITKVLFSNIKNTFKLSLLTQNIKIFSFNLTNSLKFPKTKFY